MSVSKTDKDVEQLPIYQGSVVNDKKQGFGVMTFANKDQYSGYWQDNFYNGKGILKQNDGTIVKCTWLNGDRHGKCVELLPDGKKLESHWRHGKTHGISITKDKNGQSILKAVFDKGNLLFDF